MLPRISKLLCDETPDPELCDRLYDAVYASFRETGAYATNESELDAMMSLPVGLRTVYSICRFNGEFLNAGIWQYFTDSKGLFAAETANAYRLVGAQKHAEILDNGARLFERGHQLWDSAKGDEDREEVAIEIIEREVQPEFDTLEASFYALQGVELPFDLLTEWLRHHPDEWVTEP